MIQRKDLKKTQSKTKFKPATEEVVGYIYVSRTLNLLLHVQSDELQTDIFNFAGIDEM